jgi:predicted aspartyl protease
MGLFIGAIGSESGIFVPGMVDTGSDFTIIPASIIQELGVLPVDSRRVEAFNGTIAEVPLYPLRIRIDPILDIEIPVGAYERECLIGRDILRRLTTLLNGPASILNAFS